MDLTILPSAQTSFPASSWGLERGQSQSPSKVLFPAPASPGPEAVLTSHSPLSNDLFYLPPFLEQTFIVREVKTVHPYLIQSSKGLTEYLLCTSNCGREEETKWVSEVKLKGIPGKKVQYRQKKIRKSTYSL